MALNGRDVDIEHLTELGQHTTVIFPAATNLDCVLTAHASADTWSDYTEVADTTAETPITLSSLFASNCGHITGLVIESANQDDTHYMVELSYGAAHTRISVWRATSGTAKISPTGNSAAKGPEIPCGETIYYRCMCETAAAKTVNVHIRYNLHT